MSLGELRTAGLRELCSIDVQRDPHGHPQVFYPELSYRHACSTPLLPDGTGPFCRFRIPPGYRQRGIYALVSNTTVKYVGQADNLASRFNAGYGQISPRNCYACGQPTNCRINKLVLYDVESTGPLSLWFVASDELNRLETRLIGRLSPPWNRQLGRGRQGVTRTSAAHVAARDADSDPEAHAPRPRQSGKYDSLREYLEPQSESLVSATLEALGAVVELPPTAYRQPAWWYGRAAGSPQHVQKKAWEDAGYTVRTVDLSRGTVVFERLSGPER